MALEIFDEVRGSRRALAEIGAVKKHLAEVAGAIARQASGAHLAALTNLNARSRTLSEATRRRAGTITGLDAACDRLVGCVARGGGQRSRHPSQAMDLFRKPITPRRPASPTGRG